MNHANQAQKKMCWDSEQQDASNKIKRWLPRLPHKSSLSPDTITDLWHLNCFLSKILVFVAVLFTGTLLYWIIVCCPKTVSSVITILMTLIVWRLETPHCTVSTAATPSQHSQSSIFSKYPISMRPSGILTLSTNKQRTMTKRPLHTSKARRGVFNE